MGGIGAAPMARTDDRGAGWAMLRHPSAARLVVCPRVSGGGGGVVVVVVPQCWSVVTRGTQEKEPGAG